MLTSSKFMVTILCIFLVVSAYGLMVATELYGFDKIPMLFVDELSVIIYLLSLIISPTISRQRWLTLLYVLLYIPILVWASWLTWGKGYDLTRLIINIALLMICVIYVRIKVKNVS